MDRIRALHGGRYGSVAVSGPVLEQPMRPRVQGCCYVMAPSMAGCGGEERRREG